MSEMKISRRNFIAGSASLGLSSLGAFPSVASSTRNNNRIAVIFELSGGNDGLNTHIPYSDDIYYQLRPKIGIREKDVLKLDDAYGFNKSMQGMLNLWKKNQLAIVKGCGYENPSFSHFTSNAYMHSGVPNGGHALGWVGRVADELSPEFRDNLIVNIAAKQSPAVVSGVHTPIVFQDPERFRKFEWINNFENISEFDSEPSNLSFVKKVAASAKQTSFLIDEAWKNFRPTSDYGIVPFGLQKVAACIKAGFDTQLYYVSVPNNLFDTHVSQGPLHSRLLSYVSDTISGFFADLANDGLDQNVVMLVYSEFGRRPGENSNLGTDHGTANDMYLIGPKVSGGVYGSPPKLDQLNQDGNMNFTTDFRRVYSTLIRDWLKLEPERILSGGLDPIEAIISS